MFDYLQQFNSLPKDLRDQISSPSVMAAVTELENKYKVDLAMLIMKVMIKSLAIKDLPAYFISEDALSPEISEKLTRELKEKIFSTVADYLGLAEQVRALDLDRDIEALIKEAGLVLPSANLVSRFKNILATYLRGVRSKIDTKNSLAKDVKIGGLNLSPVEIERVLRICDSGKLKSSPLSANLTPSVPRPVAFKLPPEEYDLKRALSSGQIKTPINVSLDTGHEISPPAPQLDLEAPEKVAKLEAPINPPINPPIKQPAAPKAAEPVKPVETVKTTGPAKIEKPAKKWWSFQKEEPAKKPVSVKAPEPVKKIEPVKVVEQIKKIEPVTVAASIPPRPVANRRPTPAPSATRPQMHDVRPVPKVMGPIEELQFLDPLNFRRLGKTPEETTAKIFAKIKLLEKDGYDKMVAGVRAWRQSPVNRLYLRLGQEAIKNGLLLKDAVAARQKAGQETLSMEEIEAVVSLNSKLVF